MKSTGVSNIPALLAVAALIIVFCLSAPLVAQQQEPLPEPEPLRPASRSFATSFQDRSRTNVGFSLGVFSAYGSVLDPEAGLSAPNSTVLANEPEVFTSLTPTLFASVKGRTADLWINYRFGYRTYNDSRRNETLAHNLDLSLSKRTSSRMTWYLSDTFTSDYNDYGNLVEPFPVDVEPNPANDIDVPRQRITRNSFSAGFGYALGTRGSISVFGGHELARYGQLTSADNQGFQVGVRSQYQINRWLFFNNSFSSYLNDGANSRPAAIQRVDIGGFSIEFGRRDNYEFSFSGGVEDARHEEAGRTIGTGRVGFSATTESNRFSVNYDRGFTMAAGANQVVAGDTVSLSFTQWLTRRMNFNVGSIYTNGNALDESPMRYLTGRAELAIAIHSHVLLSMNYTYVSQRLTGVRIGSSRIDRYSAGVGLQYYLPNLLERN